jgi:nicotinamide-nucleotide amidase
MSPGLAHDSLTREQKRRARVMTSTLRISLLARNVVESATKARVKIATAESCTGGLIGGALTDIPGSSATFDRGYVAYSNLAKSQVLNVPKRLIARHGAVSAEVVRAMATGALHLSGADIVVAVTGIAGPDGGGREKPEGLVWFAVAASKGVQIERRVFSGGSRDFVRTKSVETALLLLLRAISDR